ncbi:MAG: hypothetical protein ABFD46_08035 [Armatimonadota bacterium]
MRFRIFSVIFFVVLSNASLQAEIDYNPHKTARIDFGVLDSQLGVSWVDETKSNTEGLRNEGLRGIAVDGNGNIYIGDYINGKIKKFSGSGKLLAVTGTVLDNIQVFDIDKQGDIVVHNEGQDSRITKFSPTGKLIWSYSSVEVIPPSQMAKVEKDQNVELLSGFGGKLTVMSNDNIIVELNGWDQNTRKPRSLGLVLDGDGKMVKALPIFGMESSGRLLAYKSTGADGEPPSSIDVMLYDMDGTLVKQISLGNKAEHSSHYAGVRFGVSATLSDRQGGFITISYARSSNPAKISATAVIGKDIILNRYDADGKYMTHLRLQGSPFKGIASNITVAPDGSIYHLIFNKDGVDVVVYKASGK